MQATFQPDVSVPRPAVISRRRLLALVGASASASLLAACQASAPPSPTAAPRAAQPTSAAAPTSAAVGTPVSGGQLVIGQDLDPIHLDPQIDITLQIAQAIDKVYDCLTVFDENSQVQPSLAQSWDISPDGLTYVFHLRKDVKWHNGRQFVASDVVYWYNRILDPKINTQQRPKYLTITSVDVLDDYTVKFNLSKPWADLLGEMATFRPGAIPNKETVEQYGDLKTHAVGTGPYKVVEFQPGNFIRYQRNEDYWGKKPYIAEIVSKIMVDETQRIAALRTGQIHIGSLSPVGARTLANEPNVSVRTAPVALERLVYQNTNAPPLSDVRVRKALDMAIDRQEIIQKVMLGQAKLTGPTPTGQGNWYLPEEKLPAYYRKPDVAGAKQLLAEAGYPNGLPIAYRTTSAPAEHAAIPVILKEQWKALGVDVNIEMLDPTAQVASTNPDGSPNFQLQASNFTFYASPDTYVGNWIPPHATVVGMEGVRGPGQAILATLDKAEATQDPQVRQQLYQDAQVALMDLVPVFWLYALDQIDGISNQLQAYQQSFTGRRPFIVKAWLKQ